MDTKTWFYLVRRNLDNGVGPGNFTEEFLDSLEEFYDLCESSPGHVSCSVSFDTPMPSVKERAIDYLDSLIAKATEMRALVDAQVVRDLTPKPAAVAPAVTLTPDQLAGILDVVDILERHFGR